jgi:hypothetical protein
MVDAHQILELPKFHILISKVVHSTSIMILHERFWLRRWNGRCLGLVKTWLVKSMERYNKMHSIINQQLNPQIHKYQMHVGKTLNNNLKNMKLYCHKFSVKRRSINITLHFVRNWEKLPGVFGGHFVCEYFTPQGWVKGSYDMPFHKISPTFKE